MNKTLAIDGKDMEFAANAATPIRFNQVFREDLMKVAQGDNADYYGTITKLAYIMNAQARGEGYKDMNFDAFVEWLEGFSSMAFVDKADEIIEIWMDSNDTKSTPKK